MFKKKIPIGSAAAFPARTCARNPIQGLKPKLFTLAASGLLLTAPWITQAQAVFNKAQVATPASGKFIWTDWKKAPQKLKDATKLIQTNDADYPTLYAFIQSVLNGDDKDAKVELAMIDLNGDGIAGIAVNAASSDWCGSDGCFYDVYDNAGMLCVSTTDYNITPTRNGIESSAARVLPLKKNPRSKYKTNADVPAIFKL